MTIKPTDLERILQKKFGFVRDPKHKKHRWYELRLHDLTPILTQVSHSRKEIRDRLFSKIARQLRVQVSYLRGMLDCTHSRDDYYQQIADDTFHR